MIILRRIFLFYYNGFKDMGSLGKTLWLIIIVKLFIFFVVLKLFFFRHALSGLSYQERIDVVAGRMLDVG